MDFLDPSKKRSQNIRLFLGYILVAIAISLASLILLLQSYGYDVDRRTGKVIQNGLVFLDSHPVSAEVTVNGVSKGRTSLKLVMPAANYTIELKQAGYQTWSKTVSLVGGSIEQLVYPFLFPSKLVSADQQLYISPPVLASLSPDRHWLLDQLPGNLNHFDQYDISQTQNTQSQFDLPTDLLSSASGPQSLSVVEWSTDNRHLVLKHSFNGTYEFIMVDRASPADSININKLLAVNPSDISLRDKRFDRLYLYDAKTQVLSTADLKNKQVVPILDKIITFKAYGADTLLYLTSLNSPEGKYSIKLWDGSKSYLLHNYPATGNYQLNMANYNGTTYGVISSDSAGEVYIYSNPLSLAKSGHNAFPFRVLKIINPQFISFSANTRFIAAQNGPNFTVYDIDTDRRFRYKLPESVPITSKATWMDGHRLMLVADNKTLVYDFDGINQKQLSPSLASFDPYFNRNYDALYNIAPSISAPNRYALVRTEMIVK